MKLQLGGVTPPFWKRGQTSPARVIILGFLLLILAGALLLMLRPIVRRYLVPKITPTNVDSLVGSTGLVTEAIDNVTASGQVKLGAMEWTARSTTGENIPQGALIRVDRIEGVKVYVTPVNVPEKI